MKRTLAFLGAVILSFCLIGCNRQNENLSNDEQNDALKREQLTSEVEVDVLEYILMFRWYYDIASASKYSFFDIEEIYQDVIIKTCESLNITQEELYVNIQSKMNNSKITDYISFLKAFPGYMNTIEPISKTELQNMQNKMAECNQKSVSLNESEIIDFKKFVFQCRDDLKESLNIDITKFITFNDITEYKIIIVEEPIPEVDTYDDTQNVPTPATMKYYIVNTSNGWKIVDFKIIGCLEVITEDIWNLYN